MAAATTEQAYSVPQPPVNRSTSKGAHLHLLDACRGIASLAVVLHHIGAISQKQFGETFAGGFFSIGLLRPDFFFVLSGFVITWIHERDLGRPSMAKPFLLKRFWRLYPLLFIMTSIKLAAILVVGGWRWDKDPLNAWAVISSYFMLPSQKFPILVAAWTMPFEALFYCVFAVGILSSRRTLFLIAFAWLAGIVWTRLIYPFGPAYPASFLASTYHLQLLSGILACLLVRHHATPKLAAPLLTIGLLLFASGLIIYPWLNTLPRLYMRSWWALVFATIIAGSALHETYRLRPLRVPDWLKTLGHASYSTYLIHGPVLVVTLAACAHLHFLVGPKGQVAMVLCGLLAITAGHYCYVWLEKPMLEYSRRWTQPPRRPA